MGRRQNLALAQSLPLCDFSFHEKKMRLESFQRDKTSNLTNLKTPYDSVKLFFSKPKLVIRKKRRLFKSEGYKKLL